MEKGLSSWRASSMCGPHVAFGGMLQLTVHIVAYIYVWLIVLMKPRKIYFDKEYF